MDGQVIHVGESVYCIAAGQSGHEFGQSQVAGQTEPLAEKGGLANANDIFEDRFNELAGCHVKFIGTHAEYDKVDAAVVDRFKGV